MEGPPKKARSRPIGIDIDTSQMPDFFVYWAQMAAKRVLFAQISCRGRRSTSGKHRLRTKAWVRGTRTSTVAATSAVRFPPSAVTPKSFWPIRKSTIYCWTCFEPNSIWNFCGAAEERRLTRRSGTANSNRFWPSCPKNAKRTRPLSANSILRTTWVK